MCICIYMQYMYMNYFTGRKQYKSYFGLVFSPNFEIANYTFFKSKCYQLLYSGQLISTLS